MSQICYINGKYVHQRYASIGIYDRGYNFADGVYEVIALHKGSLIDMQPHIERLFRSLSELKMASPVSRKSLELIVRELIRRNRTKSGAVYIQVTRGIARRDHPFPHGAVPSLLVSMLRAKLPSPKMLPKSTAVITQPDIRWKRCDIKSISLLPNVLAKQAAVDANAVETWLINEDNIVTEGSATNAFIVDQNNIVRTHPANNYILGGITRDNVLALARKEGISVEERPFTLDEAFKAKEAFITSTTKAVMPVTSIDGRAIADGKAGEVTMQLMYFYNQYIEQQSLAS